MRICLRELALACWIVLWAVSGGRTATAQGLPGGPSQQEPPSSSLVVACNPAKPVVGAHESVSVMAFAFPPDDRLLQYTWKAEEGGFAVEGSEPQRNTPGSERLALETKGALARWDPSGIQPDTYKLTVTVSGAHHVSATCSLEIVVAEGERGPGREAGRALLVRDRPERKGYGLYSYLLLGARPAESAREHYRKVIEAYLSLIGDISKLERHFDRAQLNITSLPLPVDREPTRDITATWALEYYDYARARLVLSSLPETHNAGPYLVSSFQPLRGAGTLSGPYLLQDLSHVPPSMIVGVGAPVSQPGGAGTLLGAAHYRTPRSQTPHDHCCCRRRSA